MPGIKKDIPVAIEDLDTGPLIDQIREQQRSAEPEAYRPGWNENPFAESGQRYFDPEARESKG